MTEKRFVWVKVRKWYFVHERAPGTEDALRSFTNPKTGGLIFYTQEEAEAAVQALEAEHASPYRSQA